MNVYERCPVYENEKYLLRLTSERDASDLLAVYGDKNAVPFFNSDNCHGDSFYYATLERVQQAIGFWTEAYKNGWFVRWSIIDKQTNIVIGTIEEFRREADDYFTDCGLLRLDLHSDHENAKEIESILSLIVVSSFEMFGCGKVATKAPKYAVERRAALEKMGFVLADEVLIGHDGTRYGDYFVITK